MPLEWQNLCPTILQRNLLLHMTGILNNPYKSALWLVGHCLFYQSLMFPGSKGKRLKGGGVKCLSMWVFMNVWISNGRRVIGWRGSHISALPSSIQSSRFRFTITIPRNPLLPQESYPTLHPHSYTALLIPFSWVMLRHEEVEISMVPQCYRMWHKPIFNTCQKQECVSYGENWSWEICKSKERGSG